MAELNQDTTVYAGFYRRYAALTPEITLFLFLSYIWLLISPASHLEYLYLMNAESELLSEHEKILSILYNVASGLIFIFYYSFMLSRSGATYGKKILGIKVVSSVDGAYIGFGRAFLRYIGFVISCMLLFLPLIIQPFTKRKQALHDKTSKTVVIDEEGRSGWVTFLVFIALFASFGLYVYQIASTEEGRKAIREMEKKSNNAYLEQAQEAVNGAIVDQLESNLPIPSEITEEAPSSQALIEGQTLPINSQDNAITNFQKVNFDKESSAVVDILIDFNSIKRDRNKRTANILYNDIAQNTSISQNIEVNCYSYKVSSDARKYSEHNGQGQEMDSPEDSFKDRPLEPMTIDMMAFTIICGSQLQLQEIKLPASANAPDRVIAFDPSTAFFKGNRARVWATMTMRVPTPEKFGAEFLSMSTFNEINCEDNSQRMLLLNAYKGKFETFMDVQISEGAIAGLPFKKGTLPGDADTALAKKVCSMER
ncbi:RDD family protein [Methylophilaceae bacterium]|nr:RDD family protein [Methylophilaceae bacterium]